jgi:phosphate-selective porin OprO and OprP
MTTTRIAWLAALAVSSGAVYADDTDDLRKRLDEQEQKIKVLERKLEIQDETKTAAATSDATVKAGAGGFAIQSADGKTFIKFRGNLAVDGRWFGDESTPQTAETWLFRRVRPYVEGTFDGIYDFRFMPDFAGGKTIILDAYLAARLQPWAVLTAGKFKGPVGLERLQPDQYNRFMELGFPSSLVPNRDLGLQFSGTVAHGTVSYAAGYFDGVLDGSSSDSNPSPDVDTDGHKDWEGRVFVQPFLNSENFYLRGFGVGFGATYVDVAGTGASPLLPSYRTPGQQTMFAYRANTATGTAPNNATFADGVRERFAPQAYYYNGSLGVITEYTWVQQELARQISATVRRSDKIENKAWQVSASYFLTGEEASYAAFTPNSTFGIGRPGWGAFEIALRYHELDIDDAIFAGGATSFANPATAVSKATAAGIGLNWYLNQNVKWMLDYERTEFDGGAATGDRKDENAVLTRFSLVF